MKRLHEDPAMMALWENLPFDGMRMFWAGFKGIISA
jgi:uncharacterized protein YbaA (DUF1428 family)